MEENQETARVLPDEIWQLKLYIAGQTPKSLFALDNLKRFCCEYLADRYQIEVVDLLEHPELAQVHQIVAVPTLVRILPLPVRKVIGDLSKTERVKVGLHFEIPN